jgi:hypothetical protein
MNEPNDFHLTSGEGSILVEITSEVVPVTPEDRPPPGTRPPWMRRDKDGLPLLPPPDEPSGPSATRVRRPAGSW